MELTEFKIEECSDGSYKIVKQYKYGKRTVLEFPKGIDPFLIGWTLQDLKMNRN